MNLLLLGLDNAGKTTFLLNIKSRRVTEVAINVYPHNEEIKIGYNCFDVFDFEGREAERTSWKYYPVMDGILFLVDAADLKRFS